MERLRLIAGRARGLLDAEGAGGAALSAFALRVANAAIAFVSQILLARLMGAGPYGAFVWAWTVVLLSGTLVTVGLGAASQRILPLYEKEGRADRCRGFIDGAPLLAAGLAALAAGAGACVLAWSGLGEADPTRALTLWLVLAVLPFYAAAEVLEGIARSRDRVLLALGPAYLARPILILVGIAALAAIGAPASAPAAMAVALAATVAATLGQGLAVGRAIRPSLGDGPSAREPARWLALAFPLFLTEGFYLLLTYSDVLVLERFVPVESVGAYVAATKIVSLLAFVHYAVAGASAHRFAALSLAGERDALAAFARATVRWTFGQTLLAYGGLVVVGPFVLGLFGEGFAEHGNVLAVLGLGILARAAIGPGERVLTMLGAGRACALIYAAAFIANIGLNLLLVPHFGLMGAGAATSAALILETVAIAVVAWGRLGLDLSPWRAFGLVSQGALHRPAD